MDVTINLISGGGGVTYADNGSYEAAGKWIEGGLDSLDVGAYHNLYHKVNTSGIDGSGTKNFGRRSSRIVLKAVYVAVSESILETAWNSDSLAMSGNPVKITYGDFTGTAILDGIASKLTKIKSAPVGNLARATAEIVFELVRYNS